MKKSLSHGPPAHNQGIRYSFLDERIGMLEDVPMHDSAWLLIALMWSLPWKGFALWRAARNKQSAWFIVILLLQTVGILEIFYLFFFQQDKNEHTR